jgi:uncharacterized membrane protein YeaQ/YmgE (transglycosylase-associated protein family)
VLKLVLIGLVGAVLLAVLDTVLGFHGVTVQLIITEVAHAIWGALLAVAAIKMKLRE